MAAGWRPAVAPPSGGDPGDPPPQCPAVQSYAAPRTFCHAGTILLLGTQKFSKIISVYQ